VQRLIATAATVLALAGCATAPAPASHAAPQLRLAPALLGRPLNLQQHLTLHAPGRDQQLDVLLEADARHVQMGLVAMGQVAARLDWDGTTLTESKASWWPQEVSGSRILSDLQFTLWPVDAIQAALPAGWRLVEDGDVRTLTQDGQVVTVITRLSPLLVQLDQRREHFQLKIESRELGNDEGASGNPT
jgi:uncharacterized protein YbdZ (MbtH family)